jgi:hypothetical protein
MAATEQFPETIPEYWPLGDLDGPTHAELKPRRRGRYLPSEDPRRNRKVSMWFVKGGIVEFGTIHGVSNVDRRAYIRGGGGGPHPTSLHEGNLYGPTTETPRMMHIPSGGKHIQLGKYRINTVGHWMMNNKKNLQDWARPGLGFEVHQ